MDNLKFLNLLDDVFNMGKINVKEVNDTYRVEVAAPGLKKEDFKVTLHNEVLTVKARGDTEYMYQEFNTGVDRRIKLVGAKSEGIKAKYRDGILKIIVPKQESVTVEVM